MEYSNYFINYINIVSNYSITRLKLPSSYDYPQQQCPRGFLYHEQLSPLPPDPGPCSKDTNYPYPYPLRSYTQAHHGQHHRQPTGSSLSLPGQLLLKVAAYRLPYLVAAYYHEQATVVGLAAASSTAACQDSLCSAYVLVHDAASWLH